LYDASLRFDHSLWHTISPSDMTGSFSQISGGTGGRRAIWVVGYVTVGVQYLECKPNLVKKTFPVSDFTKLGVFLCVGAFSYTLPGIDISGVGAEIISCKGVQHNHVSVDIPPIVQYSYIRNIHRLQSQCPSITSFYVLPSPSPRKTSP